MEGSCNERCATCHWGFSCGQLEQTLVILTSYMKQGQLSEAQKSTYEAALAQLQSAGWRYPDNTLRCAFKDPQRNVNAINNKLINVIHPGAL